MKTKEMTIKEYAASKKCSVQNIQKKIERKSKLEDVVEIKKYSKFYLLIVNEK